MFTKFEEFGGYNLLKRAFKVAMVQSTPIMLISSEINFANKFTGLVGDECDINIIKKSEIDLFLDFKGIVVYVPLNDFKPLSRYEEKTADILNHVQQAKTLIKPYTPFYHYSEQLAREYRTVNNVNDINHI